MREWEPPGAQNVSGTIDRLRQWLAEGEAKGGVWSIKQREAGRTTHFAIYASGEATVPRLCIDMIADERFSAVQKRCDDYMAEGVAQVWLLDPNSKRAYTVTRADGFREFRGECCGVQTRRWNWI